MRSSTRYAHEVTLALLAVGTLLSGGCRTPAAEEPPSASPPSPATIRLTDVTEAAGIDFHHDNGHSEHRYLPETMGSGLAFADFDGDDLPDLLVLDSASVAQVLAGPVDKPLGRLYRNRGDGRFEDVTATSGLGGAFLAMGVAVGDIDNDGDSDLFITGVGEQRLYRNLGGRFEEQTESSGLRLGVAEAQLSFGSSAAFFDADRDGDLDLLVGRYVPWSPETDVACRPDGIQRTYCTPEVYESAANRYYENQGEGLFRERSQEAGLASPAGKTLGLAILDFDQDGWPDVAVANDTDRNHLFLNQGDGTFDEQGTVRGFAFSVSGAPRGAMGIDAGDLDGDGLIDLVVGNFAQEMTAVYRTLDSGLVRDEAARLGVGLPGLLQVAFGTLLVDLDLDGRLDLVLANGHIEPDIESLQSGLRYRQPLEVYGNRLSGPELDLEFQPVTSSQGPLAERWVGRGLATADFDGDGDPDLALSQNGGSLRLLRNDSPRGRRSWIKLRLVGSVSPRLPYGTRVTAHFTDGSSRVRTLRSGSSYLSANEPVVTLGVPEESEADRLEIAWPSGTVESLENPPTEQLLVVQEPGQREASSP